MLNVPASTFGGSTLPITTGGTDSSTRNGRRFRRMMGNSSFILASALGGRRETSDGVRADGDLLPVRAIADGQARHAARAAHAQVDDATRKLRRCHASGHRGCDIGERRDLNLFTTANL